MGHGYLLNLTGRHDNFLNSTGQHTSFLRIDNSRQRVICTISLSSGAMILITIQYISNKMFDVSLSYDMNDVVIE